ncbi:hybrid sensor histidine kinase/response regulator [Azohydromonas australica]|uniref:hybrid sensor histidine kinase/response regulator n=1 Tax=Azohydromonas australica TaxID=364039 RepID=UPI000683DCA5|nr:PAS domain-containing protein [Azohydromonas australica]
MAVLERLLFETSLDCIKLLDLDGRLLQINRNGCRALEVDDFEVLRGRPWPELWPEPVQEAVRCAVQQAREGRSAQFTAPYVSPRGTAKWWDVGVWPVPDEHGEVKAMLAVSRDISELQRSRRKEAATAARLEFLLEATQVGYWEADLATGCARTSMHHDRCFGYTEPVAKWGVEIFLEHVHPQDRAGVRSALEQALEHATPLAQTFRVIWPEGSVHWLSAHYAFHRNRDDFSVRLIGSVRDITERKQAVAEAQATAKAASKRALRMALAAETERARLDALLEAAPAGIAYAAKSGALVLVNAANRALWGNHPVADDVGQYQEWKGWWADGSERHGQRIQPHEWGLARALAGEEVQGDLIEIEPFGAPGIRKAVLLRASPVRDPDGCIMGAVVAQMDITDRVRAEAELRASEAKLRIITDAMPQMVWSTRPDGFHDYYNRQWYAFTGVPEGSTNGEGWAGMFHPEDQRHAWERWRHSLDTGEPYEVEYRLRHCSGQYRWVLGRALPVRNDRGRIIRWMGTCTDIHESKLAQEALQNSEESLRQADHRKDEFLAMLAHELRNPLAPITTAAQLLRSDLGDPQRVAKASAIISRQVRHLNDLVNDLLDVSRVTRGLVHLDLETLDLQEALLAAVEQVRPLIQAREHVLTIDLESTPRWVRADRTRCIQMVANLLHNAAKYTPAGGRIWLDTHAGSGYVRVQVRDNGDGIDAALLPHIFDLFTQADRTLDRSQGGLGIGLPLVRALAEMHGGRISAQSPGRGLGSTFALELPVAEAPQAAAVQADTRRVARPAAGLRIALVDDNADAAQTLAALLQSQGHEVSVFGCAGELLERGIEPPPQVCILDIGLPDMSGHELARRLRQRPELAACRLYALTGYGQERDRSASREAGFDEHFVKPVDPVVLLSKL